MNEDNDVPQDPKQHFQSQKQRFQLSKQSMASIKHTDTSQNMSTIL